MDNIISFSLFGPNIKFSAGAIENVKLARYVYPNWTCRFYIDKFNYENFGSALKQLGAELILMPDSEKWSGTFWRLLVADDPKALYWILRDCDSRIGYRERYAVNEWIDSEQPFHIIRDHPAHHSIIMAGTFGGIHGFLPNIQQLIDSTERKQVYGADELWLAEHVWPLIHENVLIHDTFKGNPIKIPFENYRFIGEIFDENENCDFIHREMLMEALA